MVGSSCANVPTFAPSTAIMITTSTITINKPVADVWAFFDNPDNLGKWLKGHKEFKHISGERGQPGAKSVHIFEEKGRLMEMEEEITRRVEGKEFAGIMRVKGIMESSVVSTFKDLGDGRTEYHFEVDGRFLNPLWKLMGFFMKGGFKKRQEANVQRMKEVVEMER